MPISSKIKALLNLQRKDRAELAKHLNISKQALSNKFYRDSFSAVDLINIADFLKCELSFIVNDSQKIVLDKSDIKSETTNKTTGEEI